MKETDNQETNIQISMDNLKTFVHKCCLKIKMQAIKLKMQINKILLRIQIQITTEYVEPSFFESDL